MAINLKTLEGGAVQDIITLTPQLDSKIAQVLGEAPQVSAKLFNTVQNLNEIFPTQESIESADDVLKKVKDQIASLGKFIAGFDYLSLDLIIYRWI